MRLLDFATVTTREVAPGGRGCYLHEQWTLSCARTWPGC